MSSLLIFSFAGQRHQRPRHRCNEPLALAVDGDRLGIGDDYGPAILQN
jgi:hypothetical protein